MKRLILAALSFVSVATNRAVIYAETGAKLSDSQFKDVIEEAHQLKQSSADRLALPLGANFPYDRIFSVAQQSDDSGLPQGFHKAIDIAAPGGTPVFAVADGSPIFEENSGSYYYAIALKHADGLYSYYVHVDEKTLDPIVREALEKKSLIQRNQLIGSIYQPKNSLPSHLHFGLFDCKRGVHLNPHIALGLKDGVPPEATHIYFRPHSDDRQAAVEKMDGQTVAGAIDLFVAARDRLNSNGRYFFPPRIDLSIVSSESAEKSGRYSETIIDVTEAIPSRYRRDDGNCDSAIQGVIEEDYMLQAMSLLPPVRPNNIDGREFERNFLMRLTGSGDEPLNPHEAKVISQLGLGWKTDECENGQPKFPNGKYKVTVTAIDTSNNKTSLTKTVEVRNSKCH